MIHHEAIVAETAPEDSDEQGHWDVIEFPGEQFPFQVYDRSQAVAVAEFGSLAQAIADAQRRASGYDENNAKARETAVPTGGM